MKVKRFFSIQRSHQRGKRTANVNCFTDFFGVNIRRECPFFVSFDDEFNIRCKREEREEREEASKRVRIVERIGGRMIIRSSRDFTPFVTATGV
jgi:hypothetical protein